MPSKVNNNHCTDNINCFYGLGNFICRNACGHSDFIIAWLNLGFTDKSALKITSKLID